MRVSVRVSFGSRNACAESREWGLTTELEEQGDCLIDEGGSWWLLVLSSDIVDHPLFHPLTDSTNRESPIRSSDLTAISFEPRLERGSYSWSQINYNEHLNASSSAVCPTFATFKSSSSSWRQNYAQKLDRSTSRSPILSISISKVLTSCTPLSNSPFDSLYAATSTLIPSRFILLFPFSRILRLLTQTVPPFSLFIEFFYFRMSFSQLMRPTRHRQSCLFLINIAPTWTTEVFGSTIDMIDTFCDLQIEL